MPLEYTAFPTPLPDAAVRLCLIFFEKVHQELAEKVERASREIASVLPDTYDMHLTKRSHYHITIFMTSQPHALRPDPFDPSHYDLDMSTVQDVSCMRPHESVLEREIQTMKDIVAQHKSPVFRVHRIVLADSGTLLLCLVEISPHSSVFHMRKAFRKAFPGSPPKQSTIYHASLGRIVTPEQLSEEKRRKIHDMCEAWTRQLQGHEFTVDELFHVREVQFTTVEGPRDESDKIRQVILEHAPFLKESDDGKKIVCLLNNHEISYRLDAINAFVSGKKYRRLRSRKEAEEWTEKYRPFLVPSVNYPNMLFCSLTNHVIKKNRQSVDEHLKGKKFQRAQENFQNDRLELYEEPTIEEMEAAIEEMEQENSMEDFEFINDKDIDGHEQMNQHKRHRDQKKESDVSVKRTRKYT
ncbi:Surfeit locus protein 2 [Picochlorum sp. SENEW3]|nr:Surfeit locus protein 2 [Picochlorum sp. SENEW3]WPT17189.1 Surfeit locus protein 2 [Picochlorum sp. SENEW3]